MLNTQKVVTGKKKDAAQKILDWVLKEIKERYSENQVSDIEESLAALEI